QINHNQSMNRSSTHDSSRMENIANGNGVNPRKRKHSQSLYLRTNRLRCAMRTGRDRRQCGRKVLSRPKSLQRREEMTDGGGIKDRARGKCHATDENVRSGWGNRSMQS